MKLIETACIILILPLFFSVVFPAFRQASELHGITLELSKKLERDSFLTKGFYALVLKNNGSVSDQKVKIREFCEMCGKLWSFESLKIEKISEKDGSRIFRCSWKAGGKENYALCRQKLWKAG